MPWKVTACNDPAATPDAGRDAGSGVVSCTMCTVTITPPTLDLKQLTGNLVATASPPGGTFVWTSSDPNVATVAGAGNQGAITRGGGGTTTITAVYNGPGCSCSGAATVIVKRNFVLVYGDPGLRGHNLGRLPQISAETHEREIRANDSIAGVPQFLPGDTVTTSHISTVSDLVARLGVNNVIYLAYFGHSWNDTGDVGALFINEGHVADGNLSIGANPPGEPPTSTPPSVLPRSVFLSGASVRLFGCRCAWGSNSAAEQIAGALGIPVYGYDNGGGSIFTNDKSLGHGLRSVTAADRIAAVQPGNVWMVPFDGTPHFARF
jgi:hypothetical protein